MKFTLKKIKGDLDVKDDNNEHYYCPECTQKRLKELADKESDSNDD